MSRWRAFFIHFAISFAVFVVLAYLVLRIWYPHIFFESDGGWQGMRIIVLVDLVLGPLLTLVVYKAGKPGLKFDLSAIATVQLLCLTAGVWIVYAERPIAMVYIDGQFTSMSAESYTQAGVDVPDLESIPGPYPKWVMVDLPDDVAAQHTIRRDALQNQRTLETLTQYYQPFDPLHPDVVSQAFDTRELQERDTVREVLPAWLEEHGGTTDDYRFYPFGARYQYIYLVLDRETGHVADVLGIPRLG